MVVTFIIIGILILGEIVSWYFFFKNFNKSKYWEKMYDDSIAFSDRRINEIKEAYNKQIEDLVKKKETKLILDLPTYEEMIASFKQKREDRGLSMQDVFKATNISISELYRIEKGERYCSNYNFMKKLHDFYNLTK